MVVSFFLGSIGVSFLSTKYGTHFLLSFGYQLKSKRTCCFTKMLACQVKLFLTSISGMPRLEMAELAAPPAHHAQASWEKPRPLVIGGETASMSMICPKLTQVHPKKVNRLDESMRCVLPVHSHQNADAHPPPRTHPTNFRPLNRHPHSESPPTRQASPGRRHMQPGSAPRSTRRWQQGSGRPRPESAQRPRPSHPAMRLESAH